MEKVNESNLRYNLKTEPNAVKKYALDRGIRFEVKNNEILQHITELIPIKIEN